MATMHRWAGRRFRRALLSAMVVLASTAAQAEFTLAEVEHRGYEQIVAGRNVDPEFGLQTSAAYNATDVDLSGDGSRLWAVFYHEFSTPKHLVWRIDSDASDAVQSDAASTLNAALYVRTDLDGSIALLDSSTQFWRAAPGQALDLMFNLDAANFSLSDGQHRVSEDGATAIVLDRWNGRVFTVDLTAPAPTPTPIATLASGFFDYLGFSPQVLEGFDAAADGVDWFVAANRHYTDVGRRRYWINHCIGLVGPSRLLEDTIGDEQRVLPIEASDDGATFAYCHNSLAPFHCFLQQAGATTRVELSDGARSLGGIVMADDASRVYVISNFGSGSAYGYFQSADGQRRWIAGSQRLAGFPSPTFFRARLSNDGQILAAPTALGAYVLHDGQSPPPGFPHITQIMQEYDAQADQLVVRALVNAPDGIERLFTLPMYQGLEPTRDVPEAMNPLFEERSGGGVNWSTTFAPVDGSPGWWERRITLSGKKAFLTPDYQIRLVVVDHTGHRTSFYDFTPSVHGVDVQVEALVDADDETFHAQSDAAGRYVVMQSRANNLDVGDADGKFDIYRVDTECDESVAPCQRVVRASRDNSGAAITEPATEPSISADGRLVAFVTADAGVGSVMGESAKAAATRRKQSTFAVYLRNILTGSTQRMGTVPSGTGVRPRLAPDGAAIVFPSPNTSTGTLGQSDIYRIELQRSGSGDASEFVPKPDGTHCVSCKTFDAQGNDTAIASNGPSRHAVISANGHWIAWESSAANAMSGSACPQSSAQVLLRNMITGVTQRIGTPSQPAACGAASNGTRAPSIDYSGRRIAVESDRALASGDDNGMADVYVVDLGTSQTSWASATDAGGAGVGDGSGQPEISGDGRIVSFASEATNIDSQEADQNGKTDIFVRSLHTNAVRRMSRTFVGEEADGDSLRPALNYNGTRVAFDSNAGNLAPGAALGSLRVFRRTNPLNASTLFSAGFE